MLRTMSSPELIPVPVGVAGLEPRRMMYHWSEPNACFLTFNDRNEARNNQSARYSFFGLFAGGRSVSFFATFGGNFALAASPSQAASVKPSAFAASSNAAHQSLGWVMCLRSFVIFPSKL